MRTAWRVAAVRVVVLALAAVAALVGSGWQHAASATVPSGFAETQYANGLTGPTAMAFAPDGRLFVAEQTGKLRVVKNGQLLATPFVTLTVDSNGERGLVGVGVDPQFATNGYVYVYYTVPGSPAHNRISRFTAAGDVAAPGSEYVLMDLDPLSTANIHNSGALHFGVDGKLYVTVGDNANGSNAQTLNNRLGKMLRLNPDGTIPTDNPFYTTATGGNRAIYAMGLRNPFTFDIQPTTGRIFINDVGQDTWEEINDGVAGGNYGWPTTEGPANDPRYIDPVYAYQHDTGTRTGCAITGGAFYNPTTQRFPSAYVGDYFFQDFCQGWIARYDPDTGTVSNFGTTSASPVDIVTGNDGRLYYLIRGGKVFAIDYTGSLGPSIDSQPEDQLVTVGGDATFTVTANGTPPLSYQWQRDGTDIPGATSSTYTLPGVTMADSGHHFRARVSNAQGSVFSRAALLTVTTDKPPSVTISAPAAGTTYAGGQTFTYTGSATDPEDGAPPASAYTWQIDFHHADHIHPFMPATSGATSGTFQIPTTGHTDANVYYRIILTVTDSQGLSTTTYRDLYPRTVQLTLATVPAGLSLNLDDQPRATPLTVTGVVGIQRTLEAPATQSANGKNYAFASWSDGGARQHTVSTPATNTTYTATYVQIGDGLSARYYNNADLTGATVNRIDKQVDFTWGTGSPAAGIDPDTFSARWVGTIKPPTTGTYTFYTQTDDGVRLWVNGKALVNDWTNHGLTERSGTVTLTAGVRYPIRMEYYDSSAGAAAHLLWSGPSVAKAVVPSSALFSRFTTQVNFQPGGAAVPPGYWADTGAVLGLRANGERYGWNANNAAQAVDRNASNSPDQRYDTLAQMQRPANPNAVWQLVVPNGTYTVRLVAGDATQTDSTFRINVENVTVVSGTPTASKHWLEGTKQVTVSDGRLTISSASGAVNNKICFIQVT